MEKVITLHNYLIQIISSIRTNNSRKTIFLSVALMAIFTPSFSATTYLVQLGSGTLNSATWRAAGNNEVLVDLTVKGQSLTAWLAAPAGISLASGDQIWIAAGTYTVSTSYTYIAGLSIFGGFAGTETATTQRSKGTDTWSFTNSTIIDGGNTMSVVVFTAVASKSGFLVDGLTITKNASTSNGSFFVRDGVTIQNCQFISNTGGAIAYFGPGSAQSSASITGCFFYNNSCSSGNGAGINSNTNTASSSMTISYCFFESNNNTHATTGGGGIRMSGSGANTVKNCIFKNNVGNAGGAAVSLNNAASTLTNCLIYGSTGSRAIYLGGGTIYNCTAVNNTLGSLYFAATTAGSYIYNSVFWGTDVNSGTISSVVSNANGVVKNCAYTSISANLTGGTTMLANNLVLPLTNTTGVNLPNFIDPTTNNWKLNSSSSLKTTGSNTFSTANTASDLIGTTRGSSYDIGAYQYTASYLPVITFTDNLTALTYGGSSVTLTGTSTSTTSNAGSPVTYTSGNAGYVTVSGKTLSIAGAGATSLTAHQSANSFYDAATDVSQSVTVAPKALTITTPAATSKVYTGTNAGVITGTLTGKVGSDDVTLTGTGTFADANVANNIAVTSACTLGGTKAGNYTLTQPTGLTANITAAPQTITFDALGAVKVGDADFAPGATSATSGTNAITYSTSNSAVATVVSGNIHIVGEGNCSIYANQATSANFDAATQVSQNLTVNAREIISITIPKDATLILTSPTADVTISSTLTMDDNKTVNSVTVEPGASIDLTTNKVLTVNGNLDLKAGLATSFSVSLGSSSISVPTGVVRYLKTMSDTKWYFISFPCAVPIAQIQVAGGAAGALDSEWFIKYYDGQHRADVGANGTNWIPITNNGLSLEANKGYIFGLASNIGAEKEVSFPLQTTILSSETSRSSISISENAGVGSAAPANYGWNLVGQPYLSKYDVAGSSVPYIYFIKDSGTGYDNYIKAFDGERIINPFTSYFVQYTGSSAVSFNTNNRKISSSVATDISDKLQINFSSVSGTDRTNIIMDNDLSSDYVVGQDLEKWLGATSSIYTVLGSIKYALNSLPITSVNNLSLEYYTQSAGASSISVNASQAPGLSQLLLTDNTNGATTDLLLSAYNFTADAGTTSGRFTISARKISTALEPILLENGANTYTISLQNGGLVFANILPSNIVRVYDALGRMVANKTANGNSLEIKLNARGIYTVQFQSGTSVSARKVIL